MRFQEVELKAIGPFTDTRLDFADSPGLTLIYGPNESGKSSALKAFRSFLFGFKRRTTQNFLHPSKQLCVGAELSHASRRYRLFRYKKNKNDLLDENGAVVDKDLLSDMLGGVSEEVYDTLYGLDHLTLVSGGESLLSGGGELSESLFSAGLGPKFHKLRQRLHDEALALWSGKSSKRPLDLAVKNWQEAQATLNKESLSAEQWRDFCHRLKGTQEDGHRLKSEFDEVDVEIRRLDRLRRAAPRVARRAELLAHLSGLGEVIRLSDDFPQRRGLSESELHVAASKTRVLRDELGEITERLQNLEAPVRHLPYSESISALHRRLSPVLKAKEQLPLVASGIDSLTREKARLQKQLGFEDNQQDETEDRTPRKKARALVSERARLFERCVLDAKALELKQLQLVQVQDELQGLEPPEGLGHLEVLLSKLRESVGLDSQLATQKERLRTLKSQLRLALDSLAGWSGGLNELRAIAVPPQEVLSDFRARLKEDEEVLLATQRQCEDNRAQMAEIERQIQSLFDGEEAVGVEQVQNLRNQRDDGWSELTEAWAEGALWLDVQEEAQRYHRQVAKVDILTDGLLKNGERLARLQVYRQQLRTLKLGGEASQELERTAENSLNSTISDWKELWRAAPGVLLERPENMVVWCQRRTDVLVLSRSVEGEEQRLQELAALHSECLIDFEATLPGSRLSQPSIKDIVQALEFEVEKIRSLTRKLKELRQRESEFRSRINELSVEQVASQKALSEWKNSWSLCLSELSLPPETDVQGLDTLLELRDELQRLDIKISTKQQLREESVSQIQSFVREAQLISEQLGETFLAEKMITQAEGWWSELQRATELERNRTQLTSRELELQAKLRAAKLDLEEKERNLGLLFAEAKVEEGSELSQAELRSNQARDAETRLAQLESELRAESGGATVTEFCAQVRGCDFDTLETRLDTLHQARTDLLKNIQENGVTRGQLEAQQAAMDGTQRGARAAQLASQSLAEGKEYLEKYIKFRLAEHILSSQMNAYRDAHKSGILDAAGEYFQKLSCGYYQGLSTNYNSSGEPTLVALSAGGRVVDVPGLSDGTRDQLYLALRLATIAQRFQNKAPLPLILDDVLVQFDSPRARAAMEILSEFAKETQIVLFSHLERDRDLAREMGAKIQLIELERIQI